MENKLKALSITPGIKRKLKRVNDNPEKKTNKIRIFWKLVRKRELQENVKIIRPMQCLKILSRITTNNIIATFNHKREEDLHKRRLNRKIINSKLKRILHLIFHNYPKSISIHSTKKGARKTYPLIKIAFQTFVLSVLKCIYLSQKYKCTYIKHRDLAEPRILETFISILVEFRTLWISRVKVWWTDKFRGS